MADSPERDPRLDRVTPAAFFDAYPEVWTRGFVAPDACCGPELFLELLETDRDYQVDDGLFVFMAHEIFEAIIRDEPTVEELAGRLMRAKDDIDAIIKWLEGL